VLPALPVGPVGPFAGPVGPDGPVGETLPPSRHRLVVSSYKAKAMPAGPRFRAADSGVMKRLAAELEFD
jgi:hypothetical protein